MKIYKSILLMLLVLSYVSTSQAQINVMENYNGDFETGTFDHWRFVEVADSTAGSYAEISGDAYTGNYAAQVTWKTGASGITDLVLDNWSSGLEVVAGHTYNLTVAIMAVEGSGLLLHATLGFFSSTGAVINESTVNWVLGDSYEVKEHVGIAPGGATNCWIAFRLFAANGSRWPSSTGITLIDDVQLWEHPPDITAIDEEFQENDIRIYPNPVINELHIVSEAEIKNISVYNMHGQLVKEIFKNFGNINMMDFSTGIYIIKVISDGDTIFRTIVKE